MIAEDWFYGIDEPERGILLTLRRLIQDHAPELDERLSYGVPYYFGKKRVCFLWPAGVKWGPDKGVLLGWCEGHKLSNEKGALEMANRKQVALQHFYSLAEIDAAQLTATLFEALWIDENP